MTHGKGSAGSIYPVVVLSIFAAQQDGRMTRMRIWPIRLPGSKSQLSYVLSV